MKNTKRIRFIDEQNDLTFNFILSEYGLKTIVTDNNSECDVALADLSETAKAFYEKQKRELTGEKYIDKIKRILYRSAV
jgi:hypothetical protein